MAKYYETNENAHFNKNLLYEWLDVVTGERSFINTGWNYFGSISSPKKASFDERANINEGILYLVNFAARFIYGCDTFEQAWAHRKEIFNDTKLSNIIKNHGKGMTLPSLGKTIYLTDKETILWMIYNDKNINIDILDIYQHLIARHLKAEPEYRKQYKAIKRLVNGHIKV